MVANPIKTFFVDESGQGVTEYGAILAFVSLLVALVFSTNGALSMAIQNSFSSISNNINQLAAAAS